MSAYNPPDPADGEDARLDSQESTLCINDELEPVNTEEIPY
jgi:hypothetical protein